MALELLSERPSRTAHSIGQGRTESGWRGRWLLAGCVIPILVLSVALAYASPPDPSWIPGIYDDRDYDDVVGMLADEAGVRESEAPRCVECVLVGFVLRVVTGRITTRTMHRQRIRGPPIETCDAPVNPLLKSPTKVSCWSHFARGLPGRSSEVGWPFSFRAVPLTRGYHSSGCLGPACV
jgi:hypothetical protein